VLVDTLRRSERPVHFAAEGKAGPPLRIVQVRSARRGDSLPLFLILGRPGARLGEDESPYSRCSTAAVGLALADTDGRFVFLNKAFRKAVGLGADERRPGRATSSSTRTRRRSPTRSAASAAAPDVGRPRRAAAAQSRKSRWR
jgi:PAS domain-containing protein